MNEPPKVDHAREFVLEQSLLQPAMLAGLLTASGTISEAANNLAQSAVLSKVQRRLIALAAILLTVVVLVIGAGVIVILKFTATSRDNTSIIRDCTSVDGACYKEGQRRTAEAVGNINEVVVAAAYCARLPANDTQIEVEDCVKKILLK